MLTGFMDHWVPTVETISRFWKTDIAGAAAALDRLLDRVAVNNFTFYTKWYTNGINSALPFLRNHPDASNVLTDNDWGNALIRHLHRRGLTVGAMLQMYTYEAVRWESDMSLSRWDLRSVAPVEGPSVIADFTDPRYRERLKLLIEEQLRRFPGLDYLFLEFEGVAPEAAQTAYLRHCARTGEEAAAPQFSAETTDYCRSLGLAPDFSWSLQAGRMFARYMSENLTAAREVIRKLGWPGTPGLVYHIYGYESRLFPDLIPDGTWWLLPWHYWGGETDGALKDGRQRAALEHLRRMKAAGRAVCCLGDATITPWDMESLRRFWEFTIEENLDGYLGMGNPDPEIGLRWTGVTDEHVQTVRSFFARELPVSTENPA